MVLNDKTYVSQAEKVIQDLRDREKKGDRRSDRETGIRWQSDRGNGWDRQNDRDREKDTQVKRITTTKIRKLLAMTADIYNEVQWTQGDLSDEVMAKLEYLRVHFVYECGRNPDDVKPFVEEAKILDALKEIGSSREKFITFSHYMEALVAYHRYYDGQD